MYTVSHVTITPNCVKQEDVQLLTNGSRLLTSIHFSSFFLISVYSLPQEDPFTFSKMLFPVCKANHWCLAVADFCTSELIWYDSMGGDGVSSLKKIW